MPLTKDQLREKIRLQLLNLEGEGMLVEGIKIMAKYKLNFENMVQFIKDQYVLSPDDILKTIGVTPMRLILKYSA